MTNATSKNLPILLLVAGIFCLATGGVLFGQCNNMICDDYFSLCDPFGTGEDYCSIGEFGQHCHDGATGIGYCTHYGHEWDVILGECNGCIHPLLCEITDEVPIKEFYCNSTTLCP
jgi:hypothetical protein